MVKYIVESRQDCAEIQLLNEKSLPQYSLEKDND